VWVFRRYDYSPENEPTRGRSVGAQVRFEADERLKRL
jgi:hypothetical protein